MEFAGGDGSESAPYQIATGAELAYLAQQVNAGNGYADKYFILTDDIDLEDIDWIPIGHIYPDYLYFYGHFDGDGHIISNLKVTGTFDNTGLFGGLTSGSVTNLHLENVNCVVSGSDYVGGLAGDNYTSSIRNCSVSGTVTISGNDYVGGLVGWNDDQSSLNNCSVSGTVTILGNDDVGGLAGANRNSSISNCSVSGTVTILGSDNVGGLTGTNNENSSIENCYTSAVVETSANYADVGGLVGLNADQSSISNCYAVGAVSASAEWGEDADIIVACAGGLVGANSGTVSNCYWNSDALQKIDGTPRATANRGVGNEGDSIPGGSADGVSQPTTAMTSTEMQTQTFVAELNANRSPNHLTDWLQWTLPDSSAINNGFPIFGADAKPDDKKDNSQDTKQPIAFTEPDADDTPESPLFSDISGHWAEEVILAMAGQGIISGYPDGAFRPENNITRAEFLTMLMRTLKPEPTGTGMVAQFDDIASNAYYYNDLLKAKAMGITKGDGKNNFHPDDPITREEMFTMTYRALETLGQLPEVMTMEFIVFSDWDDVSEYAEDPLQVLAKLKLIEGSNNAINPLANAKRAEAAQFFFNILGYLK